MSIDVYANVTRDNSIIYQKVWFQIDRMSELEASTYSEPPNFLYNAYMLGNLDLRQNDFLVDINNTDPITGKAKAYQVINEIERFPDMHLQFNVKRADRSLITRGT